MQDAGCKTALKAVRLGFIHKKEQKGLAYLSVRTYLLLVDLPYDVHTYVAFLASIVPMVTVWHGYRYDCTSILPAGGMLIISFNGLSSFREGRKYLQYSYGTYST
jgi:hypothetical protein